MAVNVQYDKVEWVEIGTGAAQANHVSINNVLSLAERVVSPTGDMIYPMQFINDPSPVGVHHNFKHWEIELTLDTDWVKDLAGNPTQMWAYFESVHAGPHYTVECDTDNSSIDWFRVIIREGDGSQTLLTYTNAATDHMWCVGEVSDFSNEPGERHQTTTWRFILFEDRAKVHSPALTYTYNPAATESAIRVMRIDDIRLGADICTNVLRFRDEYMMQMTPQFIPNTFEGLDIKQDQKWRVLTVVVDSETDIFDAYFGVQAANTVILPDIVVNFTLADAAGGTMSWTYNGGSPEVSYILNRREGLISDDLPRDTIEYQILTTCDRAVG